MTIMSWKISIGKELKPGWQDRSAWERMEKFKVIRVLSHNVVQALDVLKDEECILLGKGIGFAQKEGQWIDPGVVERKYFIRDSENLHKYQKLLETTDERLYFIIEEYIEKVGKTFGSGFDENLHIGLLDHMNFSIYRYRNKVTLNNIFIDEMSMMYEKEYAFAKVMLKDLNKRLNVELPEAEAVFIALHIHSSVKGEKASQTALYLKIIGECLQFIEEELGISLDPQSIEKVRLITHLKFALKRASEHKPIKNIMAESMKNAFPKTFLVATEMAKKIEESYGIILPQGEIGYLTMHIENIILQQKS